MATLYELNERIRDFNLDIDEETGEIMNAAELDALNLERDTKAENICLWIKNLLSDADAYKRERKSFYEKEKTARNKAERLKEYIAQTLNGEKFKTDRVAVSYRKSDTVLCEDVYKLPEEYVSYKEPSPKKAEIKKALKAGEQIPGCRLIVKDNVQIK